MIRSILVGMDESLESSKSALNVAIEISKLANAKVKGFYIENISRLLEWQPVELMGAAIGVSSGMPSSRPTIEQVEAEKEFIKEGNQLKDIFDTECSKNKVNSVFYTKRGQVDELIIEESRKVDLVVIGRRGKTYPENSQEPGPITESLLRHTTKPVVVVPEGAKLTNNILIGYDSSQTAQRALSIGALFGKLQSSEIKVVSVGDDIDSANRPLNEAEEFLSPYQLKVQYIVDFGSNKPSKAIIDQAKDFKAGLIVLGAFGANKLLESIFGSTTREVLIKSTCPVLLCR